MMCTNCGNELREPCNFCPDCGRRISQEPEQMPDERVTFIFGNLFKNRRAAQKDGSYGFSNYGSGVRQQVFEVIVRQAMAGAPWRQICMGPMQVNNITEKEILEEVARRQQQIKLDERKEEKRSTKSNSNIGIEAPENDDEISNEKSPPRPDRTTDRRIYSKKEAVSIRLGSFREKLSRLVHESLQHSDKEKIAQDLLSELDETIKEIVALESILDTIQREIESRQSFD